MGEILGIGLTHYPGLMAPDEDRAFPLTRMLRNPNVSAELKNPSNWPEPMCIEFGEDEGVSSAKDHHARSLVNDVIWWISPDLLHTVQKLKRVLVGIRPNIQSGQR